MTYKLLASAALLLLVSSMRAEALTVFEVSGIGTVCRYAADGVSVNCQDGLEIKGTLAIHVDPSQGPESSDGTFFAADDAGWVTTTTTLQWDGGLYVSASVPGETYAHQQTFVYNDVSSRFPSIPIVDRIDTWNYSERLTSEGTSFTNRINYANLFRDTNDPNWLSSADFIESLGLAPTGTNYLQFTDSSYSYDFDGTNLSPFYDQSGYFGVVNLATMISRTSVPEPATLGLLGLGLVGIGIARRRKSNLSYSQ